MKSGIFCVTCIALTSFVFLSSLHSVTAGKCTGKWMIHACYGGNGKRSATADVPRASETFGLLRRLFLRRSPSSYPPALEDEDFVLPDDLLSSSELPSSSSLSSSSSALETRFSGDEDAPLLSYGDRLASLKRILRRLQKADDDFE